MNHQPGTSHKAPRLNPLNNNGTPPKKPRLKELLGIVCMAAEGRLESEVESRQPTTQLVAAKAAGVDLSL
jgi:hypothetical protein